MGTSIGGGTCVNNDYLLPFALAIPANILNMLPQHQYTQLGLLSAPNYYANTCKLTTSHLLHGITGHISL